MKRTNEQNKTFWKLVKMLDIDETTRKIMILNFTNGRTDRSSEMTKDEMENLLRTLGREITAVYNKMQQQRRKIFRLFYKLGWLSPQMTNKEKVKKINTWLTSRSGIDKSLNDLTLSELNKVIRQLNVIIRNYERQNYRISGCSLILKTGQILCLN